MSRLAILRRVTVSFFIVVAIISPVPAISQSRSLEPAPPSEPTFTTLADWLEDNAGHSAFPGEFVRLLDMAERVEQMETVSDRIVPLIPDRATLADAARTVGRFWMIVRRYDRAADLFETAYVASGGGDLESLFGQAQALLQLGEPAAAEQRARTVVAGAADYELKRRAYALVARAMHLRGRPEQAAPLLATLAELDDAALVEPDVLLLQSSVLGSMGLETKGPLDQLARLHPESVAFRSGSSPRLSGAGLPAALLSGEAMIASAERAGGPGSRGTAASPGPSAPEPSVTRSVSDPTTPSVTAIQVGSFSDPDNARHLAVDLRMLGLEALAESVDRDGRTYELVLVSVPGGSAREASRVLGVLRDAGYDGFMIY